MRRVIRKVKIKVLRLGFRPSQYILGKAVLFWLWFRVQESKTYHPKAGKSPGYWEHEIVELVTERARAWLKET
jgi:hypothetical protein